MVDRGRVVGVLGTGTAAVPVVDLVAAFTGAGLMTGMVSTGAATTAGSAAFEGAIVVGDAVAVSAGVAALSVVVQPARRANATVATEYSGNVIIAFLLE